MKDTSCPFEESVTIAVRSGEWSPELETHRNGCMTCAELTLVAASLQIDAEDLTGLDAPLPDPAHLWLRARLASRERDYRRATRAIVWVQRAAFAVAAAVALAFSPNLWEMIMGVFSSLDLGSPIAQLPRAAGSPVLVIVGSFLVVGVLAFWELAAAHER